MSMADVSAHRWAIRSRPTRGMPGSGGSASATAAPGKAAKRWRAPARELTSRAGGGAEQRNGAGAPGQRRSRRSARVDVLAAGLAYGVIFVGAGRGPRRPGIALSKPRPGESAGRQSGHRIGHPPVLADRRELAAPADGPAEQLLRVGV